MHVIPNGEIKTLANRTKDYSFYVIDLGMDYDEDTDRVVALVREAGAELMQDPAFAPSILEPVEVLGVDDFKDSAVSLRFRIKTVPLKQWEVGRELRRRVKHRPRSRGRPHPPPAPRRHHHARCQGHIDSRDRPTDRPPTLLRRPPRAPVSITFYNRPANKHPLGDVWRVMPAASPEIAMFL